MVGDKKKYIGIITDKYNTYYQVRKQVDGKYLNFGTYTNLTSAIKRRDYLEANGWCSDEANREKHDFSTQLKLRMLRKKISKGGKLTIE